MGGKARVNLFLNEATVVRLIQTGMNGLIKNDACEMCNSPSLSRFPAQLSLFREKSLGLCLQVGKGPFLSM